ncbi:MAG TPA: hypothetical protein VF610_11045 [Segetibacter sp.]|jgi:hypothetical protein
MKKLFSTSVLFLLFSCGSGNSEEAADTGAKATEGNSAGSEIIARDSARMDTNSHSIQTP